MGFSWDFHGFSWIFMWTWGFTTGHCTGFYNRILRDDPMWLFLLRGKMMRQDATSKTHGFFGPIFFDI
jgi:hypothetical protein